MERSVKLRSNILILKQMRQIQHMNIKQHCEVKDVGGKHICYFYVSHGLCFCLIHISKQHNILENSMQGSFIKIMLKTFGTHLEGNVHVWSFLQQHMPVLKRLGIWKKCDLDVILMNGDQLYKTLDRTDYLSNRYFLTIEIR